MKIGKVTGTVVSTTKFEDYRGFKLLKVRPIDLQGEFAGEEVVALDAANAGVGDTVLINNDGGSAQMIMGDKKLIASVTICGVVADEPPRRTSARPPHPLVPPLTLVLPDATSPADGIDGSDGAAASQVLPLAPSRRMACRRSCSL